jgi:hypothetical protein
LGIGPNPQSPIPNPQSPIPNPHIYKLNLFKKLKLNIFVKFNNINLIIKIKQKMTTTEDGVQSYLNSPIFLQYSQKKDLEPKEDDFFARIKFKKKEEEKKMTHPKKKKKKKGL